MVIDFPQALLLRDIRNLCAFFAKCGVTADPDALFGEMWNKYQLNEI